MKTRRILAASTAALLAFGSVAVIASASADTATAVADVTIAKTDKGASTNVKGAISFDAGDNYVVTALKDYAKDLQNNAAEDGTKKSVADADALKTILEADAGVAALKGTDGDATVSISVKDAMKLSGWYEVKVQAKTVEEDDNENVLFDDGEAIADLGLSKENENILKKTKANKVKLFNVTVAKGGEVASSIGKSLKVDVANSFAGAKVYHVNDDGSLTLVDSKTPNMLDGSKTTTFTTSKFSPFIVTTAELKATKATTDDDSSTAADPATSNGASTTNPDTGIALAIAPVVLAAGAVAVVALKKKH